MAVKAFLQCMPSKPPKYGIKMYVLEDVKAFYTLNVETYPGTQPPDLSLCSNKPYDFCGQTCYTYFEK